MNNGWIKLHRQLKNWEWYTDVPTKTAFIHLILTCNYVATKWRGISLEVGETVQSLETLARESGISVMQWRVAIDKLKMTQSLTERKHGKFRILKLEKYDQYQIDNTIINNEVTDKQQGLNRDLTADKEDKKGRTKENKKMNVTSDDVQPAIMEDARRLSLLLSSGLRQTNPAFQQKYPSDLECSARLDSWAKDFDKMLRIDKATEGQITFVINWLFTSQGRNALFWRPNIQSAGKLREKFSTLVPIIKQEHESQKVTSIPSI